MFEDKILLITGGTGSFGNAVMEYLLNTNIREIRIFSRDEKKQNDMRMKYRNRKVSYYLGDVRDVNSVKKRYERCRFYFSCGCTEASSIM